MDRLAHGVGSAVLGACLLCASAAAEPLLEPPVLESSHGSLRVLVVARQQRLGSLPGKPVGWVYEVCRDGPADGPRRRCPAAGLTREQLTTCPGPEDPPVSPYGGVRIQLEPGDDFRVRLVNCLPKVARDQPYPGEFRHVGAEGDTLLQYNPTNLHTHGLLIEPRCATGPDDPYGDWIFVLAIDPRNAFPPELVGRHSCQPTGPGVDRAGRGHHSASWDITPDGVVSYRFRIPSDHPAGLYWIHPHAHGLSLNQVSAGLAMLLTIGHPDYLCGAPGCAKGIAPASLRHLVLKDAQVMPDGRLKLQQDSEFCGKPDPGDSQVRGDGLCRGSGPSYGGGSWVLTVNGQVHPTIDTTDATGQVWRILNASPNATYWLALQDPESSRDLPVQVLSVDGVSLDIPAGTSVAALQTKVGRRMKVVPCPAAGSRVRSASAREPVCVDRLLMMPSARVEIRVAPRDGFPPNAVLRTYAWNTGPAGDDYPAVALASVRFPERISGASTAYVQLHGQSSRMLAPGGLLSRTTRRTGGAGPMAPRCRTVGGRQVRQIVFGQPGKGVHALGYREVDAEQPLTSPGDLKLETFDHAADPTVCVELGPGDRPVSETWELVNIAAEDHNFHIHQSRFELIRTETPTEGTFEPERLDQARVLLDNVPVPRGGPGCDGSVAAWQRGACVPSRVVVRIPFTIVGDFVYHCHILGHEDAGMMAKISVVPSRAK